MFGYVNKVIEEKKVKIEVFDRIDDTMGLDEAEVVCMKKYIAELLKNLHWILYQKAKASLILEGDANFKFLHRWINKRNKCNEINGIDVNNLWVDSVHGVRYGIFQHFKDHFS